MGASNVTCAGAGEAEVDDIQSSSTSLNDNDTCAAFCIIDEYGECGHPPKTMHAYIVPVILAIITLVGLVGNSIVVFVIFYQGQLKTVTNYYIVNLAITDLAFLIACAPFTASLYATRDWVFGRFMCKFVFFLQQMTAQTTCITLVFLAIDRYKLIIYPLESLYSRTQTKFCFVVLGIWSCSALLSAPLAIVFDLEAIPECGGILIFCTEQWPEKYYNIWYQGYVIYTAFAVYVVPLSIISVCYTIILTHLWKKVSVSEATNMSYHVKLETHKRWVVTRMVLAVIVAFALNWLPLHTLNLWSRFDPCFIKYQNNHVVTAFMGVAHGLVYLNSGINPILYAVLGGNFRYQLRQIIAGRMAVRKPSTSSIQQPHARLLGTKTTQV